MTAAAGLVSARSDVVLEESFDYVDGSIVVLAADTWKNHSGGSEQTEVVDGQLELTQANSEDFHAKLVGGPFKKNSGGTMYASFDVEFTALPSGGGSYFAHFRDDGFGYRARVIAQTTGAEEARSESALPRRAKHPPPWWTTICTLTRSTSWSSR